MPSDPSSLQSLQRVFHHNFSVHDITESLVSCDGTDLATDIRAMMDERCYEVVGVREHGLINGYVERSALTQGRCSDFIQPFQDHHVVLDTTSLVTVILRLRDSAQLFVSVFGRVGGIVTRSDLQKAPVRMWLFGMVTLLEMRLNRMIELFAQSGDWMQYLSDARLQKAKDLLAERTRRNQNLTILNCLQFADKCQIIARCEELRAQTVLNSRRQIETTSKKLERLRNNLAHSQDIISSDWQSILDLTENLDNFLAGPENEPSRE